RDFHVTGVQTCALPILMLRARRRSSGEVEYSITDTGPGVPPEDRERVVHRFVRLDNSRTEPGSGLGLSLVVAVAEAHGGRVQLEIGRASCREGGSKWVW